MRYYICRKGKKKIQKNINKFLKLEKKFNFTKSKTYNSFKRNCEKSKKNLAQTLEKISKKKWPADWGKSGEPQIEKKVARGRKKLADRAPRIEKKFQKSGKKASNVK